ncbi:hypothetical protein COHA_003396 [Chlorella ohadii]|uniref:Ribosome biogenesis protein NOP53 n=1 Tax=Chlorella ohadii TaxID=2649997 RepID=A0AAD5H3Y1_9CHLO|nr:hypothetical protein COHA_003396 [Chlorella ohadii]
MAKKRTGKKAHRRLDTTDVQDFLEKSTREERQGLLVDGVPDAELFFVDKGGEETVAAAVKAGQLPRSRKEAARQKVLRSAAILAAAHNAKPAAKQVPRKPKGSVLAQQQAAQQRGKQAGAGAGKKGGSGAAAKGAAAAAPTLDVWDEPTEAGDGWTAGLLPGKRQKRGAAPSVRQRQLAAAAGGAIVPAAAGRERARAAVPAVEIDPAGCSYNPDVELHQEAVAAAVAAENRKLLDKASEGLGFELEPVAPPRTVDYDVETDELALLQTLEGGADGGEEQQQDGQQQEGSDNEDDAIGAAAARHRQEAEKKTRKDRNREKRRREAEDALQEQRKLKAQRRELQSLAQIQAELEEEEAEKEAARLRRKLDQEERLAAEPPRLSKHRFQPMPLQVLTSDELAGSLRRLKPTAMLAKDRFKSLQKRALIEPRRKIEQKKQGKRVEYVHGERAEKAQERQAELAELRAARKKAAKAAKAASKQ